MTLDDLISEAEHQYYTNQKKLEEILKETALAYAKSIIPEKREEGLYYGPPPVLLGLEFNTCRTQILSRIEEDSK